MTEKKEPVKKVSPRRRARECAVQALYSWALSGNAPEQVELNVRCGSRFKKVWINLILAAFSVKLLRM